MRKRIEAIVAFSIACVVGLVMVAGAVFVIGESIDGIAQYKSEHDRCLRNATNGYEIKKCN